MQISGIPHGLAPTATGKTDPFARGDFAERLAALRTRQGAPALTDDERKLSTLSKAADLEQKLGTRIPVLTATQAGTQPAGASAADVLKDTVQAMQQKNTDGRYSAMLAKYTAVAGL